MKLIVTIVQDEDSQRLINELMTEGFRVTKARNHRRIPPFRQHHAAGRRGRRAGGQRDQCD